MSLGQLGGQAPVNFRTNQHVQVNMGHIAALRSGAEAKAQGSKGAFSYETIRWRGQVVALVKNEQSKASQFASIDGSRVLADNGDRFHLLFATTKDAYLICLE